MRTMVLGVFLAATVISAAACDARKHENVVMFKDTDTEMAAAIAQARQTADTFVTRLSQPSTPDDFISVKIALPTSDGALEHIWCDDVQFADGSFSAAIANDPIDKQYTFGQRVSAPKGEISDWMYVQDGKLVGGYTLRYAYAKMTPADQAKFRDSIPFQIE